MKVGHKVVSYVWYIMLINGDSIMTPLTIHIKVMMFYVWCLNDGTEVQTHDLSDTVEDISY